MVENAVLFGGVVCCKNFAVVRLDKSATHMLAMLRQTYGDETLLKAQVCKWHKVFKEGREIWRMNNVLHIQQCPELL